jgi:phospholipid/cholesterol/gamma-HCH transport system substrate-binding protein
MRRRPARAAVVALAITALVTLLVVVDGGRGGYVVRAQFTDASQLVTGDLVEVGGRKVGEVTSIDLSSANHAEIELSLDDDSVRPLHEGTRAVVRTVGLSGIANRFVDLRPGPETAPAIPDGGVLPATHTQGVVDLDALLNALDPSVRRDVKSLVRDMAKALDDETAQQANAGLELLNPAVVQLTQVGRSLTRDQAALRELVRHTASVSDVLARHRSSLGGGVEASAAVLETIAAEREELAGALDRAPAALRATTSTLRRARTRSLPLLDPVLTGLRPAVRPGAELLREIRPTLADARPLLASLERLVPQARAALEPLPELSRSAAPAMESVTAALRETLPVVRGLRPYTPDLVAGFFHGFGGSSAHSYDANGHYARIMLDAGTQTANGLLPRPPVGGLRTGLTARCPGAAEEPAPDRSNPWPEGAGEACDPEHNK